MPGRGFDGPPPFANPRNAGPMSGQRDYEGAPQYRPPAVSERPAQRYYGKVKVFGNLELRTELTSFHIGTKALVLGIVGFFDAGRVWTELTRAHPDLDGTGVGLKYGVGGGLRLQQGQTFVVRADLAWSPDARPLGAYFAAGQIF